MAYLAHKTPSPDARKVYKIRLRMPEGKAVRLATLCVLRRRNKTKRVEPAASAKEAVCKPSRSEGRPSRETIVVTDTGSRIEMCCPVVETAVQMNWPGITEE